MRPERLALIPARGGSKDLPRKNIRLLGGKPLIAYAIQAALSSACFDRIIVSTDDPEIAAESRRWGADVPWLRPAELATDSSTIIDTVFHVLDKLEDEYRYIPESVVLLQPTSPFRTAESIRAVVEMLDDRPCEAVVSVSAVKIHPYWCRRITEKGLLEAYLPAVTLPANRQELPKAYVLDGGIYARKTSSLRRRRSFHDKPVMARVTPPDESLDIDDQQDWELAEFLLPRRTGSAAR